VNCPRLLLICAVPLLLLSGACQGPPSVQTEALPAAGTDSVVEHPVREGETLPRIADLYYGDPGRAGAIAVDNGVEVGTELAAGSILRLHFADHELAAARQRQAAMGPYNRGVAAMAQADLNEAERQFRLALRTVPELHVAGYNLALVLIKRGRHEEASELLISLVSARPDDPDFGFALGNALFYQTRYDEAVVAFGAVLEGNPDHRRAAFGHARALQEAGRRDEALTAWSRYLRLDPSSPWADEARRLRDELQGG